MRVEHPAQCIPARPAFEAPRLRRVARGAQFARSPLDVCQPFLMLVALHSSLAVLSLEPLPRSLDDPLRPETSRPTYCVDRVAQPSGQPHAHDDRGAEFARAALWLPWSAARRSCASSHVSLGAPCARCGAPRRRGLRRTYDAVTRRWRRATCAIAHSARRLRRGRRPSYPRAGLPFGVGRADVVGLSARHADAALIWMRLVVSMIFVISSPLLPQRDLRRRSASRLGRRCRHQPTISITDVITSESTTFFATRPGDLGGRRAFPEPTNDRGRV